MRGFDARGSWRAGRPPDLFDGRRQCRGGKFRLLWCAAGSGGDMQDFRAGMLVVGAGGPVALQTSPPVRRTKSVDTDPHAALRALLVGLRPPTPQSPEGLRSTPFDCVAIAPCCFAFRKAVLSHALAALTALVLARTQCRYGNSARGADRDCARENAVPLREFRSRRCLRCSHKPSEIDRQYKTCLQSAAQQKAGKRGVRGRESGTQCRVSPRTVGASTYSGVRHSRANPHWLGTGEGERKCDGVFPQKSGKTPRISAALIPTGPRLPLSQAKPPIRTWHRHLAGRRGYGGRRTRPPLPTSGTT